MAFSLWQTTCKGKLVSLDVDDYSLDTSDIVYTYFSAPPVYILATALVCRKVVLHCMINLPCFSDLTHFASSFCIDTGKVQTLMITKRKPKMP